MSADRTPLERLRAICLALPEVQEKEAWGEATFRVRNKVFVMHASPSSHHTSGRPAAWCKAAPGEQQLLVRAAPERFFAPPYVGPGGWVGVWLDEGVDWEELADMVTDAYRLTAPRKLLSLLP